MSVIQCYRDGNNFGYTNGSILFENGCNNNIIISDKYETKISNLQDSLMIIEDDVHKTYPLEDFDYVSKKIEKVLYGKTPKYYIPLMVQNKENLNSKNLKQLSQIISSNYRFNVDFIKKINRTGKGEGVFYIKDETGHKYVLKHYGKEKEKLNLLGYLTNSLEGMFPKISLTINKEYALKMDDGYYGLEQFVEGTVMERNSEYFVKVGEKMSLMHTRLNEWLEINKKIKSALYSNQKSISDSNILSLWTDMTLFGLYSERIEVERIAKSNLRERIFNSPESFIHADLNNANIIWKNLNPKFIDIETAKYSRRILDFEGTLLFKGNMLPPEYIQGSMLNLFEGYNKNAKLPILNTEFNVIGDLMVYSVLKNFVVRNLRRGEKNHSLKRLKSNIKNIRNDC